MAKLSKGILGGISGTVGNVVGGSWRGIDYIRSKPSKVNNPNTEGQRKQRMRFRLVIQLLRKIRPLINIGFRNGPRSITAMNQAMSVNLREAIDGTYPDLEINPETLVVSRGDLHGASVADSDLSVANTATVNWDNEAGNGDAANDDAVMVLFYNPEKDAVIYKINGAIREDETVSATLPDSWSGDKVAAYLAFQSVTSRAVSNGLYLGEETAA